MNSIRIKPSETVCLKSDLLSSKIGEEIILLTEESGKYFRVNGIGSRIWELIKNPISIIDLKNKLTKEYEVDEEQCLEEILDYLTQLKENDLVLVS